MRCREQKDDVKTGAVHCSVLILSKGGLITLLSGFLLWKHLKSSHPVSYLLVKGIRWADFRSEEHRCFSVAILPITVQSQDTHPGGTKSGRFELRSH